jgi:hypothetical protein
VLGKLPQLAYLWLTDATAPDEPFVNRQTRHLRPLLSRSLKRVSFSRAPATDPLAALHALARWTSLPPAARVPLPGGTTRVTWAIKGWDLGWTAALQRELGRRTGPRDCTLVLVDDADVDHYVAALPTIAPACSVGTVAIALGSSVSPAAFCRLLRSAQLPLANIRLTGTLSAVPTYAVGWSEGLGSVQPHFQELLRGGPLAVPLELFATDVPLGDFCVGSLARVAGAGLKEVVIEYGAFLTDAALYALAVGCPLLERATVMRADQVTAAGVQALLGLAGVLRELRLGMGDVGAVVALLSKVQGLSGGSNERAGAWKLQSGCALWTRG